MWKTCLLLVLLILLLPALAGLDSSSPARAQSSSSLASTFAPVLHFTSGERFFPTSVDYLIGASALKQRLVNGSSTLVNPGPTPSNLGTYNSTDYFLDNKLGTRDAIANDYSSKVGSLGYFTYVHVANGTASTVIQYWLFYAYNNGPLNDHEGDLEVVELFLDSSGSPQHALYSQHGAGENAAWNDVEKSDTHPVVYVAQGSHANYFRPYQGKIGVENDVVQNSGPTINPANLKLVLLGEKGSHTSDQSWLDFPGRWGYVGTDQEIVLGRAGPLGPVFNQGGTRWSQPQSYLSSTLGVDGNYFILAFLAAYLVVIVAAYLAVRGAWKVVGIARLHRKGGLLFGKFLKSRGLIGLLFGAVAIVITVVALFLPWYSISASSQSGPLAQHGSVTLLSIDGIHGVQVNLFTGAGGDSTSGFTTLFLLQIPFAIFLAVGTALLALDIIGVKNGRRLGSKFILGAISSLLPFILIFVFINQLPSFLPLASGLLPGTNIPPQLDSLVRAVAGNPVSGSASQQFDVVGTTMVNWGYGLGAYLFLFAALVRIIGGFVIRTAPELGADVSSKAVFLGSAPPPPIPLQGQTPSKNVAVSVIDMPTTNKLSKPLGPMIDQ